MNKFLIVLLSFLMISTAYAADNKLTIRAGKTDHQFLIEVADNDVTREKGLMFRKALASDHGMLFVFHEVSEQNFWMKNTLIPLDIIFISKDGKIVKIHQMAKPNDLTLIPSGQPVAAALEIKGGEAARRHLKEGNRVIYPLFAKTLAHP